MKNLIGVQINYKQDTDLDIAIQKAKEMGLESCQLNIWDMSVYTDEHASKINEAVKKHSFKISSIWAGWPGPREWNFQFGPSTIGLVPPAYRALRMDALKAASDFAEKIGVDKIATHVGFIPENPDHPDFTGTVTALRDVCSYLKKKNQYFLFETGQETPTTMLRTIETMRRDNVGVNFDTANLLLYGKANPLDALDILGKYVMDTHIKDGFYPTDGTSLGKECVAGQGKANIAGIVRKLQELGYTGSFTIEREISGEQQIKDIMIARDLLRASMLD